MLLICGLFIFFVLVSKHDDITVTVATIWRGQPKTTPLTDPHFSESIYVYTGDVPPLSELTRPPRKVSVGEEEL